MTHCRLLALDIETVPDAEILPPDFAADAFPKPVQHRVVVIGFALATVVREGRWERYTVEECRCGGMTGSSEGELLRGFWHMLEREKPRVVTWNGRGFDIPVLQQRALVHGIQTGYWHQAGDRWSTYRQRYAVDWHCDLMEAIGDHGAAPKTGMDDVARAIGLPGKIGGHGSEVAAMVAAGRLDQARAYCEADVLNLLALYFRWSFLTGRTDALRHNAAMDSLIALLEAERDTKPHFGEFLDRWRASVRPTPFHVVASSAQPGIQSEPDGAGRHLRSEDVL